MASVLVVDDDEWCETSSCATSTEGFESRQAADARRRAERSVSSPDLVILDVMLPR